jgi:molybdate transport system substrate-binding protein
MGTLAGCTAKETGKAEIQVFIASSLNTVMTEIAATFQEDHPEVTIIFNADSSGKLLTQIEEGYECDIFFSAAQKQMDQLEQDGLVVEKTRQNIVNNQLVVLTSKDSKTKVTGLENLGEATSLALADGSVPAGKYTRQAMIKLGILPEREDASKVTAQDISTALGGLEISEQGNVSKVLIAIIEGSCEVGTTYYSDTYGYENKIDILEKVSYEMTGDIIYPICRVTNLEADSVQQRAADDFYDFILSDTAKDIFEQYYFDIEID